MRTIFISHSAEKYQDALVLDRMEPFRPVIDQALLRIVLNELVYAGDFTITCEGLCRLNPQLARKMVLIASSALLN